MRDGIVEGISFKDDDAEIAKCEACAKGKQHRLPFEVSNSQTKMILELIHSDIMGPMETRSIGHARYILTFINDFTRKLFIYFLMEKPQTFKTFVEFRNFVEKQTDCKVKTLWTENGTKYHPNYIKRHYSNVYTPQQNGLAERMNRTLIERAKCMLFDTDLPKHHWAEAINMAAYVINRSICSSHAKPPEAMWTEKRVKLSNLRIFGSPIIVNIPK